MVMVAYRTLAIDVLVDVGIRRFVGRQMHMGYMTAARQMMIAIRAGYGHRRPFARMGDGMLDLRNAMQVQRRQQGDAETSAEMAKQVRQRRAPAAGVAFTGIVRNAWVGAARRQEPRGSDP